MSAIAISNAVEKPQFEQGQKHYFDSIKGYTKKTLNAPPKMSGMLTQHLETGSNDILSYALHELKIDNKRFNPCLTPFPIHKTTTKTQIVTRFKRLIEHDHFVKASGGCESKALIIALTLALSWLSAPSVYAQTPACAVAGDAGNSYDNCTGGVCERMVCNGTSYVTQGLWTHSGWQSTKFGNDTSACNAGRTGRLRYSGGTTWQYCNGTTWTNW